MLTFIHSYLVQLEAVVAEVYIQSHPAPPATSLAEVRWFRQPHNLFEGKAPSTVAAGTTGASKASRTHT